MRKFHYLIIGTALAAIGMALYKYRHGLAKLCSDCGGMLKGSWKDGDLKKEIDPILDKAEAKLGKAAEAAGNGLAKGLDPIFRLDPSV